jgi:hypothetical protein
MRFIDDNDDDEYEDDDRFIDEGEYESILSQQTAIDGFHLHILEQNLKSKILFECFKFCKSNIFWFFYSEEYKLNKIKNTYKFLIETLEMKE